MRTFWLICTALVFGQLAVVPAFVEAKAPETACVKYGQCPLSLAKFVCVDTARSSFIRRVCHDASESFMVIKLKGTWYPYCAIGSGLSDILCLRP